MLFKVSTLMEKSLFLLQAGLINCWMSFPTAMICSTTYIPVSRKDVLVCIVQNYSFHTSTLHTSQTKPQAIPLLIHHHMHIENPTNIFQNNSAQTTLWLHHTIHKFTFRRNGKAKTSHTRQTKKQIMFCLCMPWGGVGVCLH